MKKLFRSILIIVLVVLMISPVCFAKEDDKVDFKKQVKKEDGSLFEKIIAECIGGLAQTVFDFTSRRRSKCRI